MKVLIQTVAGDIHAAAVGAVLLRNDVEIGFSVGSDIPLAQLCSVEIANETAASSATRNGRSLYLDCSYDLIWCRRIKAFQLPELHPDDVAHANREFGLFLEGFWQVAAPHVPRLNPAEGRDAANSKLIPLIVARKCGFSVSPTLASHDPTRIKVFVEQHGLGNVIYKPFAPMSWKENDGRVYGTPTTLVCRDTLNDEDGLRICPGIFQKYIPKAKEFRVTVMGAEVHSVQIYPATDGNVDWRINVPAARVEVTVLPFDVSSACREVVAELGLLFGCIDLVLGTDGEWYFLEVNEMGQFLWIEELRPDVCYLDAFVDFLFRLCGDERKRAKVELDAVLRSPEYESILIDISSS